MKVLYLIDAIDFSRKTISILAVLWMVPFGYEKQVSPVTKW